MSGIYLHIPFCKQACYYCDFHFSTSLKRKDDMLRALEKELILRKEEIKDEVETIYFGGGTPSLLSNKELDDILEIIYKHYKVSARPEISLEANPDDLNLEKIKELSGSLINRLSIGVQSFRNRDLRYMNRAHNADEARKSLEDARNYFDNISIDLIYGLPELSEEDWQRNLDVTFELGVQHISSYALTVEPKTALYHFINSGKYKPLRESVAEKHFNLLKEATKEQDYIHYEISNFGKKGFFSKHNTSYWKGIPYIGIGPSAHSYNGYSRSWNVSNNAKYTASLQNGVLPNEKELLSEKDQINERLMTGLRTMWGVSIDEIRKRYGNEYVEKITSNASKYVNQNVLYYEEDRLFLRPESYFLADGISSDLFLL